MSREMAELKRLEALKAKKRAEMAERAVEREKRMDSIRRKQFDDELGLNERANRIKQEQASYLLAKTYANELARQERERDIELRKYWRDKYEIRLGEQVNRIESMENFYRDKLEVFGERVKSEKKEWIGRERDELEALRQMKAQAKLKLDKDFRRFQEQLFKSTPNFVF
jgi:hypothetical protein